MLIYNEANGKVTALETGAFKVPFNGDFGFYVGEKEAELQKCENGFAGSVDDVEFVLAFAQKEDHVELMVELRNLSGADITEPIGLHTGIDSYMVDYPQWHEPFFPTLLRCEKTHIWGYYMNTAENALAFVSAKPVASYNINYNMFTEEDFGHRVTGTDIVFFQNTPLPQRHPQDLKVLRAGETYTNTIYWIPVERKEEIVPMIAKIAEVPMVQAQKYTCEKGEALHYTICCNDKVSCEIELPDGSICSCEDFVFAEYGIYQLRVTAMNGKQAEATFCCRRDWDFYLQGAAKEALRKPQKASTHVESFYGLFSMFLAAKYNNDEYLLKKAYECFHEIMPYMFDQEKIEPIVIPGRIQNTALFISILVDIYELAPQENQRYLELAAAFGDWIMTTQTEDGAYRNGKVHYTCVIYIAKAMLELTLAERSCRDAALKEKAEMHYMSVKRAVDDLVAHLDNIDTEGELTLEDGMISCSALQIAMFALTLPKEQRVPYTKAAEYMMKIHSCLEQQLIPDCRMNGCSLRYWESQYDVMIRCNMLNSPHGWTAWTAYGQYYLYLLTGKKEYLVSLMNTLGSCAQLLNLNGNLRWSFCAQPYVKAPVLVPDLTKEVADGYQFVDNTNKAYRGKYEIREFGEQYVEMISDWYRVGEQKVMGGYDFCPLFLAEDVVLNVDNQGGCCDNDVHEIFKCIEECVLRKAYVYENEDGSFLTYGCQVSAVDGMLTVVPNGKETELIYNLKDRYYLGEQELDGFGIRNI